VELNFEAPLNSLSFGNVAICLLREFYNQKIDVKFFPISNVDVRAYNLDKAEPDFKAWIEEAINKSVPKYHAQAPSLKLWHLNGSHQRISHKQVLLTFHELDTATPAELNIVKNNDKVLFCGTYSKDIFNSFGCDSRAFDLGFDDKSFYPTKKSYLDDRITFGLFGKLEPKRKGHKKVIQAWVKRFGKDKKYFLNCALYNHFLKPEIQEAMLGSFLGGKGFFNVQFLPFMENNSAYNDYLESNDIAIGMGTESWDIPAFTSVAKGKYGIILNAAGHKDWANKDNSILINPSGKIPAYDGIFFHPDQPFNQGQIFDFNEDEFIAGCEEAIKRFENNRVNEDGLKLQQEFTWKKSVNNILFHLEMLNNEK